MWNKKKIFWFLIFLFLYFFISFISSKEPKAITLYTFIRVPEDISREEFIRSAQCVEKILQKQPGFLERNLVEESELNWFDVWYWKDEKYRKKAEVALQQYQASLCNKEDRIYFQALKEASVSQSEVVEISQNKRVSCRSCFIEIVQFGMIPDTYAYSTVKKIEKEMMPGFYKSQVFFNKQKGFISRTLAISHILNSQDPVVWYDIRAWENATSAQAASKLAETSRDCKDYLEVLSEPQIFMEYRGQKR